MKDIDAYKTILEPSEGEFKDRGSKFFGYVKHIKDEDDFAAFLKEVKAQHFKARHHCFGYRLMNTDKFRYSDDGEPSGTAGKPIFNQLLSFDLVDVACVVVRYFGGTKLGTSGLINAYKKGAKEAIENATIELLYQQAIINIAFDYGLMGNLMKALKYLDLNIDSTEFGAAPNLNIKVNQSAVDNTIERVKAYLLERSIEDITDKTEVEGIVFDTSN